MKKIFVLIRQGNLEEVKNIIEKRPDLLNCIAGPQPKKDHGQSLLQVAFKTGKLDIADYLIEKGIDVDFMEAEDDDPGLRVPVLFDAITATIDVLCIDQFATQKDVQNRFDKSDKALELLKKLIIKGADINKRASHGLSALNWSLHHADSIMKSEKIYPFSQEKVREQLGYILDLLIDNGADYETWLEEGLYPEPSPGPSVKTLYFDNENSELGINYNAVQHMRRFLQTYFTKKGL